MGAALCREGAEFSSGPHARGGWGLIVMISEEAGDLRRGLNCVALEMVEGIKVACCLRHITLVGKGFVFT